MPYPKSIENLINLLTKLPTVGPKTAERYVFYFLQQGPEELQKFAQAISELKENTLVCQTCFAVADQSPCQTCCNQERNHTLISVVSNTRDMLAIESTKYNGIYHVLGGTINVIEGTKPENLQIKPLLSRIKQNNIEEVILALSPSLEGETTSMYLVKLLKQTFPHLIISRIAKGLPMGADLEYADELTVLNAMKYRNKL